VSTPWLAEKLSYWDEENRMMKLSRIREFACLLLSPLLIGLTGGTWAQDQHPILDQVANKVIQKYQNSTCEQLWAERENKQPPSPQEQRAVQFLRSDPQMRTLFINRVAAPVANKMFACGMIP
jgi:hypothetical protein